MRRHLKTVAALFISFCLGGCGGGPKPEWVHNPPVDAAQHTSDFNYCSAYASDAQKNQPVASGNFLSNEFWYQQRDECLNERGWTLLHPDQARKERDRELNPK
jgi:hypothetical protein